MASGQEDTILSPANDFAVFDDHRAERPAPALLAGLDREAGRLFKGACLVRESRGAEDVPGPIAILPAVA